MCGLERSQKGNQCGPVFRSETQAIGMAGYRARSDAISLEAGRSVVTQQASRVKPILQGCAGAVVRKHASIPDTLERRYLVKAGAAPGVESETRVRIQRDWQNLVLLDLIRRRGEALG